MSSPEPRSSDERAYLAVLEAWSRQTETGDRAEVADLPEELSFWSDIAATSENCVGTECPRYRTAS